MKTKADFEALRTPITRITFPEGSAEATYEYRPDAWGSKTGLIMLADGEVLESDQYEVNQLTRESQTAWEKTQCGA